MLTVVRWDWHERHLNVNFEKVLGKRLWKNIPYSLRWYFIECKIAQRRTLHYLQANNPRHGNDSKLWGKVRQMQRM